MTDDVIRDCRKLYELMRRFWAAFGYQMASVLARDGINIPQYMAMVALDELGGATMGELSKKLHVTMGASTNIVDKLVRGGYVSRRRSTSDRRVVNVVLEKKGRKAIRDVEERAMEFMAHVLAREEPEVRRQFLENYERMVRIAEAEETTVALTEEDIQGVAD